MLALAIAMLGVWSVEKADAQLTILHRFGDGSVPNDGAYPLSRHYFPCDRSSLLLAEYSGKSNAC